MELDVRRHLHRDRARQAAPRKARARPDHAEAHRHRMGSRIPVRTGGSLMLPDGIQWSDLIWISERLVVVAVAVSLIGTLILRRMANRSIGSLAALVVLACSFTTLAGAAVLAGRR